MKVKENGKIEWIMVKKAYFEWLPIRERIVDPYQIYRAPYGSNIDLVMLDTRLWTRCSSWDNWSCCRESHVNY
jgi:phosphodiesterase/alkaline phosphatase D-like protein